MEKLLLTHLMIGPLILILAIVYKSFPELADFLSSKKAKHEGKEIWREANRYSAKAMIFAAIITIVFQTISLLTMQDRISVTASTLFLVATLLSILPLTEIHLRKKFWYKGRKSH